MTYFEFVSSVLKFRSAKPGELVVEIYDPKTRERVASFDPITEDCSQYGSAGEDGAMGAVDYWDSYMACTARPEHDFPVAARVCSCAAPALVEFPEHGPRIDMGFVCRECCTPDMEPYTSNKTASILYPNETARCIKCRKVDQMSDMFVSHLAKG